MNLFLIAYAIEDGDTDWFYKASDKDWLQDDLEVRTLIADNYDIKLNEFDRWVDEYWVNKISEVDGYKVKLVKE